MTDNREEMDIYVYAVLSFYIARYPARPFVQITIRKEKWKTMFLALGAFREEDGIELLHGRKTTEETQTLLQLLPDGIDTRLLLRWDFEKECWEVWERAGDFLANSSERFSVEGLKSMLFDDVKGLGICNLLVDWGIYSEEASKHLAASWIMLPLIMKGIKLPEPLQGINPFIK